MVDLDNATAVDPDKLGAQFFHASTASEDNVTFEYGVVEHPQISATTAFQPLGDGGAVSLFGKTELTEVAGVDPDTAVFTVNPGVPQLAMSLQQVRALTYGNPPPEGTDFANGKAYTFIGLGDPAQALPQTDGGENPRGYHYLALPNNPVIPYFAP